MGSLRRGGQADQQTTITIRIESNTILLGLCLDKS